MSRPIGKPALLATTENFDDVGEAWHNTELARRPADGVIATGLYKPDKPLAADYANWRDKDFSRRLRDLDTIEIRNWSALINTVHAGPTPAGTPTLVRGLGVKLWHEERPLVFMANEDEIMISYDGGLTWAADISLGAGAGVITDYAQCDLVPSVCPALNVACFDNAGAGEVARTSLGSAWGSQALTSCTATKGIGIDPYSGYVIVCGTHSGTFGIWRAPAVSGALTFTAVDTGDTNVSMGHVACSPTVQIAANDVNLWRWAPGTFTPTMVAGPQGGGVNIADLHWLPEDELFILVAHAGAAAEVWTSPDGVTWTDKSAFVPTAFDGVATHTAATRGSIFAVSGQMTARNGILWTGDAGLTWNWEPDPIAKGGYSLSGAGGAPGRIAIGDRQWLAAAYDGSGNFDLAFGLRMGA